ncbi:hypothetical protein OIU77_021674 [Salix suchowensis]|uniref:Sodium/calcium exchanger membrane region domain-containing protein n=1 Tax=Salix suchowensis TaxID=1278906 RepID=A0ABQ9CBN5_9ROSI|nr:hypothetical protein OIU77_021674 [Salix suchowensis]
MLQPRCKLLRLVMVITINFLGSTVITVLAESQNGSKIPVLAVVVASALALFLLIMGIICWKFYLSPLLEHFFEIVIVFACSYGIFAAGSETSVLDVLRSSLPAAS